MTFFSPTVKNELELPEYIWGSLLEPLSIAFQRPITDPETTAKFLRLFGEHLSHYPEEILAAAAMHILTTRTDHWFPTLAEILKVCRKGADLLPATTNEEEIVRRYEMCFEAGIGETSWDRFRWQQLNRAEPGLALKEMYSAVRPFDKIRSGG